MSQSTHNESFDAINGTGTDNQTYNEDETRWQTIEQYSFTGKMHF